MRLGKICVLLRLSLDTDLVSKHVRSWHLADVTALHRVCPLRANSRHWDCRGTGYEYRRMACAAHIGSPRIILIKPGHLTYWRSALKTSAPTPVRRSSTHRRALKTRRRGCRSARRSGP